MKIPDLFKYKNIYSFSDCFDSSFFLSGSLNINRMCKGPAEENNFIYFKNINEATMAGIQ